MNHLSVQGVSLNKETLLNDLKKDVAFFFKKKVLGSSSDLDAEASLHRNKAE